MVIWQLDGLKAAPLELTTTGYQRATQRGVILHRVDRIDPDQVAIRDGMRITSITRTLIDLCAVCRPGVVEQALESALRLRLTSLSEIRSFLDNGARGYRRARLLVRLVEAAPEKATASNLEVEVWALIRGGGLPAPRRQYEVRSPSGRVIARPDFAYPDAQVAIEADGYAFHSSRRDWQRDRERQNAMIRLGWKVYRVTREDVAYRGKQVVDDIAALLDHAPAAKRT